MLVSNSIFILLVLLCQTVSAISQNYQNSRGGLKPTTNLLRILQGSVYNWFDTKTNRFIFVKYGTYSRIVSDFYSANPTDIKAYFLPDGMEVKYGRVGNLVITTHQYNKGYGGELNIFQEKEETQRYVIYYIGYHSPILNRLF